MSDLEILYKELESKSDFSPVIIKCNDYPDKDQQCIEKEIYALRNDYDKKYSLLENLNNHEYVNYFEMRYSVTANIYLKAKYSDVLYFFTRKQEWYIKTLNLHKQIIEENITKGNDIYNVNIAINRLIEIAYCQKKIIVPEVVDFFIETIKKSNYEHQLFLIQICHKNKLFKQSESKIIVDICTKAARNIENYGLKKGFLDEGIYYAQKDTSLSPIKKQMFEMLGDNEATQVIDISKDENNIALAHINRSYFSNMINYYHKASCLEKENEAFRRLNLNKSNLKFFTFKQSLPVPPDVQKLFKDYYNSILELDNQMLFLYLSLGDILVFPPEEYLVKIQSKDSEIYKSFAPQKDDLCGNSSPINNIYEFNKYEAFNIFTKNNLWIMEGAFLEGVKNKKITYPHLIKFLNKSCFSIPMSINQGDVVLEYTWLNCIDYALHDFIKQSNRYVMLKQPDWRFATDSLTLKFEGILRDMLALYSGNTTKLKKNGDKGYSEMLLDDLLRDPKVLDIFSQDDINLFFYVFTNQYFNNIRNYVAHGLFKPQNYNFEKVFLVFLCIMRLTNYSIKQDS